MKCGFRQKERGGGGGGYGNEYIRKKRKKGGKRGGKEKREKKRTKETNQIMRLACSLGWSVSKSWHLERHVKKFMIMVEELERLNK